MKLSLANTAYIVRDTGLPVEGRMKVFLHESDTYANVYTLEGEEYVQAENPQLLHAGLPEASLFTETGIYDLVIEQYIGQPGNMSVESPDSDFAKIDEFQWGLDFNLESLVANRVDTLDELRDVDPSLKAVTVLWYSEPGDCVPRTYWWDAGSMNIEDGGYVVGSNLSDSGRWILMWDDEILPACVYGVQPGSEANMNLLLNYPSVVGSFGMSTAPCVRFQPGTYTSSVDYATTKELVFDAGAKFTNTTFTCPKVRVFGNSTGYIADFILTRPDAEAHSSWFRTLIRFWTCGAKYLYIDDTNHFTNSVINRTVTVQDKVILGSHRLEATYSDSACIVINRCDIGGKIFTPAYDYVRLATDRGDGMFVSTGNWDAGLVSAGHHIQYDNEPELVQFDSADRWYATMDERKARMGSMMPKTGLDFMGRTCSQAVYTTNWSSISNLVADGGVYVTDNEDCGVTLDNVKGNVNVNSAGSNVYLNDCNITIPNTPSGLMSLTSTDSNITVTGSVGLDPTDTALYITGGQWIGYVKLSDAHADTYSMHKAVVFTGVTFPTHFCWRVNYISMTRCTGQVSVDLLPYVNATKFSYAADFTENVFIGPSRIWFTMYGTQNDGHGELDGNVNFAAVRIVYNRFNGTDPYGIKLLRWHPFTMNTFMSSDTGYCEYHDNSGACPRMTPGILDNVDKWTGEHTGLGIKWRTYDGVFNIWAPYAVYNDGSINNARDMSGIVGSPAGGSFAYVVAGLGEFAGNANIVAVGYQNGLPLPQPEYYFNEDANNIFIVRPCISVGLPACPTYNTGYTIWYKPYVV